MAEVKDSKIGNLRGKLGNLTARIVYGKTILSARPINYRVSYAPHLVRQRNKFTVSSKFAQKLITLSALREIWLKYKEAGMSAYNYIIKTNYPMTSPEKPTVNNIITPHGGFHLPATHVSIATHKVSVWMAPLDSVITAKANEQKFVLNGVLCYYNPFTRKDDPYVITTIGHAPSVLNIDNNVVLEFTLNEIQHRTAMKYRNYILYLALATLDGGGRVVQYSETFVREE